MPRPRRGRRGAAVGVAATVLLAASAGPAVAGPVFVETFALAIAGQASVGTGPQFQCSTGAAPAPVFGYFGPHGPFVPNDGLATCNIAGGFDHTTSATGPLADSRSLTHAFNSSANSFAGSASASAQYGKVGAAANASFSGGLNAFIYEGAEAFGKFRETFSFNSPTVATGAAGSVRMHFTVDGSISTTATTGSGAVNGTGDVEVMYQQDAGPIFSLMRAQVNGSSTSPFITAPFPGGLSGFTSAPGSVSGSGVFDTFSMPIVFGNPFDFTLGLLAYAIPGTGATVNSSFVTSAQLTGISVFNAAGQQVTSFDVTSGSGTAYNANGVQLPLPVPEPATLPLLGAALVAVGYLRRRGR